MTRLLLSLEDRDRAWIESQAASRGISMAEVVRLSLRSMQSKDTASRDEAIDKALSKTRGVWRAGDGLEYQRKIRAEWK